MVQLKEKIKALFSPDRVEVVSINPGYESTNDVFEIISDKGQCIIKVAKSLEQGDTFWRGLNTLFGLTHANSIQNQAAIADQINQFGTIKVPRVLKADPTSNNVIGMPFVILEKCPGEPIPEGSELEQHIIQDEHFAFQLGRHIGSLHANQNAYFGTFKNNPISLRQWPTKLQEAISVLARSRKALQDEGVQRMLPYFLEKAAKLTIPSSASLILLDCWPSQFLIAQNAFFGIDIEAYVVGPPALELTLLELWLGSLSQFKEGYFSVNPIWPEEIEEAREVYRFFIFLLYGCPEQGLDNCIYSNAKFAEGTKLRARITAPRLRPRGYPGFR